MLRMGYYLPATGNGLPDSAGPDGPQVANAPAPSPQQAPGQPNLHHLCQLAMDGFPAPAFGCVSHHDAPQGPPASLNARHPGGMQVPRHLARPSVLTSSLDPLSTRKSQDVSYRPMNPMSIAWLTAPEPAPRDSPSPSPTKLESDDRLGASPTTGASAGSSPDKPNAANAFLARPVAMVKAEALSDFSLSLPASPAGSHNSHADSLDGDHDDANSENHGPASANSPHSAGRNRRRKRWCSICQGLFSNLATHRSTHLAANVRPHVCDECGRGFARPNDLLRHQRSHKGSAAFVCPFYNGGDHTACHITGRFSRCDTYKNHLKAVHFEYPRGTRKSDRTGMSGQCKECRNTFESASEWITHHIESGECPAIRA